MTDPQPVPTPVRPETSYFLGRDGVPRFADDPYKKRKKADVGPGTARPHQVPHPKDRKAGAVPWDAPGDTVPRFTAEPPPDSGGLDTEARPVGTTPAEQGTGNASAPAPKERNPAEAGGEEGSALADGADETMQGGAAAARGAHNPEVGGSSPPPATYEPDEVPHGPAGGAEPDDPPAAAGPNGTAPPDGPAAPEVFRTAEAAADPTPSAPKAGSVDPKCPQCTRGLVTCEAGIHQYKPVTYEQAKQATAFVVNKPYELVCRVTKRTPLDACKVGPDALGTEDEPNPLTAHAQYMMSRYDKTEGGPVSDTLKLVMMVGAVLDQQMAHTPPANDNGAPPAPSAPPPEPPADEDDEDDAAEAMH